MSGKIDQDAAVKREELLLIFAAAANVHTCAPCIIRMASCDFCALKWFDRMCFCGPFHPIRYN